MRPDHPPMTRLTETSVARATPSARHVPPPTPRRRLLGAFRLLHPFPTLMNALATTLFASLAAGGWPGWGVGLRLAGTMLAAQSAIGIANDYADRALDRATKPHKPLAAGLGSPPPRGAPGAGGGPPGRPRPAPRPGAALPRVPLLAGARPLPPADPARLRPGPPPSRPRERLPHRLRPADR